MPLAIVTGASAGIGREFALLCGARGYDTVLVARSREKLEALAGELRARTGREADVLPADLSRPEAPGEIHRALETRVPEIEVLINNAGYGLRGRFAELEESEQQGIVAVNVNALTHLTRLFAPGMIARRNGYILNVASTAAFQPGPLMAVYFATKAYVLSLSEALHEELKEDGVRVTALCPGATRTEFDRRADSSRSRLFQHGRVMGAGTVARIGLDALFAGKPSVVAGTMNATMSFLTRFSPRQMNAKIARRLMEDAH